ncbi:MAG: cob(I)yrinic acid a,c-diamide adenosyltransferase [Pirellulaceae bacterium]
MKIYTKTGDSGQTGLFAGPRVWKDDPRIEAYGTIDELNATLGCVQTELPPPEMADLVTRIQHHLFAIGAELASPDPTRSGTKMIRDQHITELEEAIDHWDAQLPPLSQFILPAGGRLAVALHMARAICRRAERHVVAFYRHSGSSAAELPVIYLNRLSDLLFVLARAANQLAGCGDVGWEKP